MVVLAAINLVGRAGGYAGVTRFPDPFHSFQCISGIRSLGLPNSIGSILGRKQSNAKRQRGHCRR